MYVILDTNRYWFTRPVRYSPGKSRQHIWDDEQQKFLCDDRLHLDEDAPRSQEALLLCERCIRYARQAGIPLEEQA